MSNRRVRITVATLLALAAAAFAAWIFIEIADEVADGETRRFDEGVLLAFREEADRDDPLGPSWVEEMARDVTGVGGTVVLTFTTIVVTGFFLLRRKWQLAAYVAGAVATGAVLSSILKSGFDRPRPDLVAHGQAVYSASFPSGHSMLSAVVFLTLGAMLSGTQPDRHMKAYILAVAVFIAFAVGVSRVYLGVHWPTDVLGGWAAGAGWALACWGVARHLRERGRLD
jgi:undecaprenyl-diphosphatase